MGILSGVVETVESVTRRPDERTVAGYFDSVTDAGRAVDAHVVLLGRTDLPGADGEAEAERMRIAFGEGGATFVAVSEDAQESEALFAARRLAYPALERLGPVLTEDACVPAAAVPEMLVRVEATAARQLSPAVVAMQQAVKAALDPTGSSTPARRSSDRSLSARPVLA